MFKGKNINCLHKIIITSTCSTDNYTATECCNAAVIIWFPLLSSS